MTKSILITVAEAQGAGVHASVVRFSMSTAVPAELGVERAES